MSTKFTQGCQVLLSWLAFEGFESMVIEVHWLFLIWVLSETARKQKGKKETKQNKKDRPSYKRALLQLSSENTHTLSNDI